jgi:hypothetical protein
MVLPAAGVEAVQVKLRALSDTVAAVKVGLDGAADLTTDTCTVFRSLEADPFLHTRL